MKKSKLIIKLCCIFVFLLSCFHNILRILYLTVPSVNQFFDDIEKIEMIVQVYLDITEYAIGVMLLSFLACLINAIVVSYIFKDVKSKVSVWLCFVCWFIFYVTIRMFYLYATVVLSFLCVAIVILSLNAKHMITVSLQEFSSSDDTQSVQSKTHISNTDTNVILQFSYIKHLIIAFLYAGFCLAQLAFCINMIVTVYNYDQLSSQGFEQWKYSSFYSMTIMQNPIFILASLALVVSIHVIYKSITKTLISSLLVIYTAINCLILPTGVYDGSAQVTYIIAAIVLSILFSNFFVMINYILNQYSNKANGKLIYYKLRVFIQLALCTFYVFTALYFAAVCFAIVITSIFTVEGFLLNALVTSSSYLLLRGSFILAILMMLIYKSINVSLASWSFVVLWFIEVIFGLATISSLILGLSSLFMLLSVVKYIQISLEQYAVSLNKLSEGA